MYNDRSAAAATAAIAARPAPIRTSTGIWSAIVGTTAWKSKGAAATCRVWDNYIAQCMMMIGNAADSIGPLYIWRNVVAAAKPSRTTAAATF